VYIRMISCDYGGMLPCGLLGRGWSFVFGVRLVVSLLPSVSLEGEEVRGNMERRGTEVERGSR
jgi:hypothetical protein